MSLGDDLAIYHRFRCGIADEADLSGNDRGLEPVGSGTVYGDGTAAALLDLGATFTGSVGHFLKRSADDDDLDFGSGDFTISVWIKPTDTTKYQIVTEKLRLVSHPPTIDRTGWTVVLYPTTGQIGFFCGSGGTSYDFSFTTSTGCTFGQWNHVLVRRNGSAWTIWINGVQRGSATSAVVVGACDKELFLGQRTEDYESAYAYKGSMDEFGIYLRAVSDAEIATIYNSGAGYPLLGRLIGEACCPKCKGTSTVRRSYLVGGKVLGGQGYP